MPRSDARLTEFERDGYLVLDGYLTADELAAAVAERDLMYPSPDDYHDGTDPGRNERFATGQGAGVDYLPFASVEWSLLAVHPRIVGLAAELLGSDDIRLYQAESWAKYTGAVKYGQRHHRDFGNHTIVVPTDDARFAHVEMFLYLSDVDVADGATRVVSARHTADYPAEPRIVARRDAPELYDREIAATGPAGTLLVYRPDTFHRGAEMTRPRGARYTLHMNFRRVEADWVGRRGWGHDAEAPMWQAFVERASVEQLALFGFPRPGHEYWNDRTLAGVALRYPGLDLTPYRAAAR